MVVMCTELLRDGFGDSSAFKVILVELETTPIVTTDPAPLETPSLGFNDPVPLETPPPSASMERDERIIGYALYCFGYSSWVGRYLVLEDILITAEHRSKCPT